MIIKGPRITTRSGDLIAEFATEALANAALNDWISK